jgi:protein TonB
MEMAYYQGTTPRPDQAKAIAAVVAVHVALAFIILTGLNVRIVSQAVERLTTINITQPPPPPPVQPPPKPAPRPQAMKKPEGAAGKKAEPSPIVAPAPKLPVPSPVAAARVAGTGSAATSGAAISGTGTGAGGAGTGAGGGGARSGFTPPRQITTIPNREYRRLAATGISAGSVGVAVRVNTDGSASNCRVMRSSGNSYDDVLMCELIVRYLRFDPARDGYGRPVAKDIAWSPRWWKP